MKKPTREELIVLLFSDQASEAWEGDALEILSGEHRTLNDEPGILGAVKELMDVASVECGATEEVDGETAEEDLEALACWAKRCAILLLHAAWAAEQAAKPKPRRPRRTASSKQLSLVEEREGAARSKAPQEGTG